MNEQSRAAKVKILTSLMDIALVALFLIACARVTPAAPAAQAPAAQAPAANTPAAASGATTYIATLDGAPPSARAVIVVEDGKFDAYVCSFDDAFNLTSARWYKGELDANGNFEATSKDGVTFKGTVQGDQFNGSVTNTEQQTFNFSGSAMPADGVAGLYRGVGQHDGKDVIVGAVLGADGTNAATAQYKGVFQFVSPVVNQFASLGDDRLGVKIGSDAEQIVVERVKTLKGASIF